MMNADIASEIIKSRNHAESIRNRRRGDLPDGGSGVGIACVGSSTWKLCCNFIRIAVRVQTFRFTPICSAQAGPIGRLTDEWAFGLQLPA